MQITATALIFGRVSAAVVGTPIVVLFVGLTAAGGVAANLRIGGSIPLITGIVTYAVIAYGLFINNVIDFLIVAFVIFLLVRTINQLQRKKEEAPPAPAGPTPTEKLLTEIRDELKARRSRAAGILLEEEEHTSA